MRTCRILVAVLACSLFGVPQAFAQDSTQGPAASDDTSRDGLGRDIKAYITSPLRWKGRDWLELGGAVAAVGTAYQSDERTLEHFFGSPATLPQPTDTHDSQDAVPALLFLGGTWLSASIIDDDDGRLETRSMLEAAALGTATSYFLKSTTGRLRPFESIDHTDWRMGGDSFPSIHTTVAFAIGGVLAESGNDRYRWVRRVLGYGMALGTAYERLDHGAHWTSDTFAGALIGIASARFVLKRRDSRDRKLQTMLVPTQGGLLLSYAVALK